ncbi:MAG: bacteriohemerythrin [Woeseiaceae bacterium]|nr:bacteriohemerythrin [Woeseiaceae bacterium]
MTLIKWRKELKVGIEEIDEDHRALIELINGLHDVMQLGADQVQVVDLLGEIYTQIASHFALEEKMMRDTHYVDYAVHKEDHDTLLDEVREIMDEVEDDGSFDAAQLSSDLNRWFSDHFSEFDAKLHQSR